MSLLSFWRTLSILAYTLFLRIRLILLGHRPRHICYSPLTTLRLPMTQNKLGGPLSPDISHNTLYPSLLLNAEAFPVTLLTIADRLYLASYLHPPTADTIFPYSEPPTQSPRKRSQKAVDGPSPAPVKSERFPPYYFTLTTLFSTTHFTTILVRFISAIYTASLYTSMMFSVRRRTNIGPLCFGAGRTLGVSLRLCLNICMVADNPD